MEDFGQCYCKSGTVGFLLFFPHTFFVTLRAPEKHSAEVFAAEALYLQ